MIEQNILNAMLQTGVLAITIPVVLIVAWKMYTKRSLVPFWVGIMVFIAFSRMLEMIPHSGKCDQRQCCFICDLCGNRCRTF